VLSCSGSDREQVQAIVHDIGQLVLETQAAARNVRLSHAREIHAAQALRAEGQLHALELRRAALLARHGEAAEAPAAVRAELASLQRDITAATARARELERRTADLEFVRDAEQQQLGLTFRLVDERTRAIREPLRGARVAAFAAVVLAVVGPVVAIVLGAFDARLYGGADVLANRFPLLGTVPALPGDDAGSDRGRRRAAGARAPGRRS
jgi:hypothetical protein